MGRENSLGHFPAGSAWEFDESVAACFDDMAARSIPLYHETTELLCRLASRHVMPGDAVLDLGCSTANVLRAWERLGGVPIRYFGVDERPEMVTQAAEVLAPLGLRTSNGYHDVEVYTEKGDLRATLMRGDLRRGIPFRLMARSPKAIFLLWTAQFVPLEHRQALIADCRRALPPGGCLLIAEKLRGQHSLFQHAMAETYHDWKARQGYSRDEIAAKAKALEGVLVSLDAPSQKAMLTAEGFHVEEVSRYLGFASWYCLPR